MKPSIVMSVMAVALIVVGLGKMIDAPASQPVYTPEQCTLPPSTQGDCDAAEIAPVRKAATAPVRVAGKVAAVPAKAVGKAAGVVRPVGRVAAKPVKFVGRIFGRRR